MHRRFQPFGPASARRGGASDGIWSHRHRAPRVRPDTDGPRARTCLAAAKLPGWTCECARPLPIPGAVTALTSGRNSVRSGGI